MVNEQKEKNWIIQYYEDSSPEKVKIEDIDGTFYPKELELPMGYFIPPAEARTFITDWNEDYKDWYSLSAIIHSLLEQSFVAYYKGLYQASFFTSSICVELILKYELARKKHIKSEDFEKNSFTFGNVINKAYLRKIGLENYSEKLDQLNKLRNGIFHFNPKKLKEMAKEILVNSKEIPKDFKFVSLVVGKRENSKAKIEEIDPKKEPLRVPTDNLFDWSGLAHFAYTLAHDIINELYGENRILEHINEGLREWELKNEKKRVKI